MRWDFHGLIIEGMANDANIAAAWARSFSSLPPGEGEPHLRVQLAPVAEVPSPPDGAPDFTQGELLAYYVRGSDVVAHFPRYGQLRLDLARGVTDGRLTPAVLDRYGVLEDMLAISLSPHLRRRGFFLIHAFAAAWQGRGLLLVGGIGAGKTTTGMALLAGGWQLLSNDSPVVGEDGRLYQYPGVLAAYPATFARFPAAAALVPAAAPPDQKISARAETIWPGVWWREAPAAAICFPQIEARGTHRLERLTPAQALTQLLPHAIEQWDRELIPRHLTAVRTLAESAPAFLLRLGPDVAAIPPLLREVLE